MVCSQTFKEFAKPIESVEPWLLITGLSRPSKIAPLYDLGSNLFLKFFRFEKLIIDEIFPISVEVNAFFSSLIIKFEVPSAVSMLYFL